MDAVFAAGAVVPEGPRDPSLFVGRLFETGGGRSFDVIVVIRPSSVPDDDSFQAWLGRLELQLTILGQLHVVEVEG